MHSDRYFYSDIAGTSEKSTLDNMNNQAEADLQKSNQCLNMTLDKYETILYDITTAEDFLNFAVTAKESAGYYGDRCL